MLSGTKSLFILRIIQHLHHHHVSAMDLGHLLTRSGLKYPEVSSKVCHDSFCQMGNSVSLSWVIYYEAFYLHVLSSFSCIPVICLKLVLFFIPLQICVLRMYIYNNIALSSSENEKYFRQLYGKKILLQIMFSLKSYLL